MKKAVKKELKGPSLTIKWASASSFFIFVVFTIFAVITYKSSVNLIVEKERENVERTVAEVGNRLANVDDNLTVSEVYEKLKAPSLGENDLDSKKLSVEGSLMEMDTMLSELGQPPLFLSIYDTKGTLVFETQKGQSKLIEKEQRHAEIKTLNDKTGFLIIQPVRSKSNREPVGYIQAFYELSSFYDIRNRLLLTLIILEVVSLILSSILGFILSSYFLKPLKVLRDTMDTIRKDPQSDIHMPNINSNDELADLAEIFNEMLDRMRRYIEQQEQFVEDVSHELRTPVAIIEGHLNLLNRWGKEDPEVLDESLEASLQEIVRMKSLVQEMLDLSRAEQVDIQYSNRTSNAKQVVYQVFNNFKILYPDFVMTLDDDLPHEITLGIYRNHFEQLLIIILDNAVKYSTSRKEVHVSISKTLSEFEIAIQDFGEGIPEEDLDKIFNRFYRVDKARARNKGGNGLGLSIAKQLVENYKGRIDAESVVHQGTIFRIYIPIVTNSEV
ncbi:HAMP domain-containing sensor histidine kinase [Candidatus Enterococcus mansonii]|uniref:Signal transduction histidine-protein kinase ArlS n=1 Tax=Candidatus Enterococcus mansonii TaxID=1834181 RepID=A0A242C562_9ENTE|nr:HAMP domain-containing histidine kinase [Enterococcus sp. 4G2_DIV0659]OTO05395.1 sensor histidine kinase [Enterococcus sp. 4G2_DIV0659]